MNRLANAARDFSKGRGRPDVQPGIKTGQPVRPAEKRSRVAEQAECGSYSRTIRAEGVSELERTAWALILSGLAAGLSMGFSLVVQGELHANLPPGPVRVLLTPMGYTVGFLIVVLGRQQLFTENTLTPILPLLHNRDLSTLGRVVRLWVLVLAANMIGTWVFAAAAAHLPVFEPEIRNAFAELSR